METSEARQLLGLPAAGALEPDAVRQAYRAAVRSVHPDVTGQGGNLAPYVEARDVLLADPAPPGPAFVKRRLTANDFAAWAPRSDDRVVADVVDVLRGFDDVLAGLGGRPPVRARARVVSETVDDAFESARGVFHDTGWSVDCDDTGLPYLVLQGLPPGVKVVVRAAGDRLTVLAPDGSSLTVDYAGNADYRPG